MCSLVVNKKSRKPLQKLLELFLFKVFFSPWPWPRISLHQFSGTPDSDPPVQWERWDWWASRPKVKAIMGYIVCLLILRITTLYCLLSKIHQIVYLSRVLAIYIGKGTLYVFLINFNRFKKFYFKKTICYTFSKKITLICKFEMQISNKNCIKGACITQWSYQTCLVGPPKTEGSQLRVHKMWYTGGRNGKPLQYSCHENPMNSMKSQKDMTLEDESPQVRRFPTFYWGRAEGNY